MTALFPPPYEGGCLCGAVRYRVDAPPTNACQCHCSLCRRAAGAPVVAWATVPKASFRYLKGTPARFSWSPKSVREFCGACGSQLTFRFVDQDGVDFTLATLDRPEAIAPEYHVWTAAELPWLHSDDGLPRYPGAGGPIAT